MPALLKSLVPFLVRLLPYLAARIKEPSTAAGIGAIATGLGMILGGGDPAAMVDGVAAMPAFWRDPEAWQTSDVVGAVVTLAGVAATFLKEHHPAPKPPAEPTQQ